MISRTMKNKLLSLKNQFPALGILGPRQSGKTALVKILFPNYHYINLESVEEQEFAKKIQKFSRPFSC